MPKLPVLSGAETKLDAVRNLARFEASAAVESRSKLIDEHNAAFRWIVASLFALNGGAILSIFGKGGIGINSSLAAFWVFLAGIIAIFLTVIFAQISDRLMIAQLHRWGLYWTTVCITGARDENDEKQIKGEIANAESYGLTSRRFAFVAMLLFILGVLTTIALEQRADVDQIEARIDRLHLVPTHK
jgi:hypothetical protein